MNVARLHRDAVAALSGEPGKGEWRRLANMAWHFADMVGWATGVIDRDGQLQRAFGELTVVARRRFQANHDPDVAALHDAIADLIDAIARHDRELMPSGNDDDDIVDM
ncbi:MAG: hypothetical protein WAN46_11795 [Gammaproteobacteria bacterium]